MIFNTTTQIINTTIEGNSDCSTDYFHVLPVDITIGTNDVVLCAETWEYLANALGTENILAVSLISAPTVARQLTEITTIGKKMVFYRNGNDTPYDDWSADWDALLVEGTTYRCTIFQRVR